MIDATTTSNRSFRSHDFGGLRLIAAIRMAFDPRKLAIAALGLILLHTGWSVLDLVLPESATVTPGLLEPPGTSVSTAEGWTGLTDRAAQSTLRLFEPIRLLTNPLQALLDPRGGWGSMLHALLGLAWLLIVWGICGGAIARLAVVQECKSARRELPKGFGSPCDPRVL